MFAAVCCDIASADHQQAISVLLGQYGFKKMLKDVYEHISINKLYLKKLKRDIDKLTDSYDIVRIYQYPMDNTLVISSLKSKKWRKLLIKI